MMQLDGFKVGDRVSYCPAIDSSGPKRSTGTIIDFREGRWGNYAKVAPDSRNVTYVMKRTDRIRVVTE